MTNLQQLKEEVMKEVKWLSLLENDNEAKQESFIKIKEFIDSLIAKADEGGKNSNKENLDNMIESMRNENRLDDDIVISEGRLRDYIEKYFII